jgi:hypothetical protein
MSFVGAWFVINQPLLFSSPTAVLVGNTLQREKFITNDEFFLVFETCIQT